MPTIEETITLRPEADPVSGVPAEVVCPLCGYDQSGAIAAWRNGNESPLRGRCSECGLDWHWGDLLHPAKQLPNWFAENPRRWAVPVLISTWRRALRPRRFWETVLVTMPVHCGRLVMFAAAALFAAYVVAGALGAWNAYQFGVVGWRMMMGGVTRSAWADIVYAAVLPIERVHFDGHAITQVMLVGLVWWLLMPLPFLVLRDSFSRIRVRRVHLLWVWAYSLSSLPLPLFVFVLSRSAARWVQHHILSSWTFASAGSRAAWEASQMVLVSDWVFVVAVAAWLAVFWSRAIRLYLHLPNPRAVVGMMMLASFLAATAVVAYFPGSTLVQRVAWWFA
jgi:hypothetical protein